MTVATNPALTGRIMTMLSPINIRHCEAIDSETCLRRDGLPHPPVVCTSFSQITGPPALYGTADQWRPLMELFDSNLTIVGYNLAYDICCYMHWGPPELRRLIYKAYDEDRVLDAMVAQRLVEIEEGDRRGYMALDMVARRYGLECPKDLTDDQGRLIRLSYGHLLGVPIADYPQCYRDYAEGDARDTIKLFERIMSRGLVERVDLAKMTRFALGLALCSGFGLRTDPARVEALREQAVYQIDLLQGIMIKNGFMRRERSKPNPVRTMANIRIALAKVYGLDELLNEKGQWAHLGPDHQLEALKTQGLLTKGNQMATSRLVLEESGDPLLISLAEYGEWSAVLNKDLKIFGGAVDTPFHTRFGFAATTRTTSAAPNIQNFRKKAGVRECIVPAFGAFVASDFAGLENGTLAQVIVWTLGRHGMADKISAGWDFHSEVGASMLGISYEEMIARVAAGDKQAKMHRSAAKPLNFGLPGFMTKASTVQSYARIGYKVDLPVERWAELINVWYATQHDQVAYLREYVDGLRESRAKGALYTVPIPSTTIIRRGATRTAAANTGFQGLGAQVAGRSLYLVTRAQMLGEMPGRVCAFIHDENITDCARADVPEVASMQERLMIQATEELMPNVKMKVETIAMDHWSKDAAASFDSSGRLAVSAV